MYLTRKSLFIYSRKTEKFHLFTLIFHYRALSNPNIFTRPNNIGSHTGEVFSIGVEITQKFHRGRQYMTSDDRGT